jgi:CBS domain-containing protein
MVVPPVSQFMTSHPWMIDESASLASARKLMTVHRIHHLPVVDDTKLVGIVSERDLRFTADVGADLRVRDVMTENPYQVLATTALDEVVEKMSPDAYGSVIVISATGGVEGIFTMVDACRALADVLHQAT